MKNLTYKKSDYESRMDQLRSVYTYEEMDQMFEVEFESWTDSVDRAYGCPTRNHPNFIWCLVTYGEYIRLLQGLDQLEGKLDHYFDDEDTITELEQFMITTGIENYYCIRHELQSQINTCQTALAA